MKLLKTLARGIGILFLIPMLYLFISLLLTFIPGGKEIPKCPGQHELYLSSNGVHLDLILPKELLSEKLKTGLFISSEDKFLSFGWGDKNFYINTPTWGDLTLKNAFLAMLTFSDPAMHVTRFSSPQEHWETIRLCDHQLSQITQYINGSFFMNSSNMKIRIDHPGYGLKDEFYEANGSFSCFFTCNSWVNSGLKTIDMPSCLWTPYDFWLISKYE
jgi:uncharacterized protein (TIGR02117 family)